MNWGYYLTGFGLGTFKFLFSHWSIHAAAKFNGNKLNFLELFIPTTLGAVITMLVFYYTSELIIEKSLQKKIEKNKKEIAEGKIPKQKKKFTRTNKTIIKIKSKLGQLGITLLAPLFLSIPIGSIICAKFYRHKKTTLFFMLSTVIGYSLLMCSVITLFF